MTRGVQEPAAFRFGGCYVQLANGCWLWQGASNNRGYPTFTLTGGDKVYAHRFAYEHAVGPIPDGLELDHLCHQPLCVNPQHLEPVTAEENKRRRLAQNATTCSRGHLMTEANTYRPPSRPTRRMCKTCTRQRAAARLMTSATTAAAEQLTNPGDPHEH
jgi:hypothetical protein